MLVLSASVTGWIVVLPDPYSMIASKIRSQGSDTGFAVKVHIPDSLSRFRYRIRIQDSHSRFTYQIRIQDSHTRFTYQIRIQDSHTGFAFKIHIPDSHSRFVFKLMPSSMNEYMQGGAMQCIFSVADEGCPSGGICWGPTRGRCGVSFRDLWGVSFREPQQGLRPGQMSSIFVKFTWHANPHYRYL